MNKKYFFVFRRENLRFLPMRFPIAQTACSQTFEFVEFNKRMRYGNAFAWTTACVCWVFPEAIFVNAHVASNCISGYRSRDKHWTSVGKKFNCMNSSIGGWRSMDKSFLAERTAWYRSVGFELCACRTIWWIVSSASLSEWVSSRIKWRLNSICSSRLFYKKNENEEKTSRTQGKYFS